MNALLFTETPVSHAGEQSSRRILVFARVMVGGSLDFGFLGPRSVSDRAAGG
jgi:hypothetical protein